ncbi:TRAP transporter small permease [Chloroflexota bacterium]
MRPLEKLGNIFDRVVDILAYLAGVIIIFMMISIVYEIFMRYFLASPTKWVVDVTALSILFMTFLGTAWVLRRGQHVKVDIVTERLSSRAQALLNIIVFSLAAIACLVLTWYSGFTTWDNFKEGTLVLRTITYPKAPVLAIIPIGSFLLFIQFLRNTRGPLRTWRALGDKD